MQFEPFSILLTNACRAKMTVLFHFIFFLHSSIHSDDTSPGDCQSVMLENINLLGSQNVRELQPTSYCQTTEWQQRHPNETNSGLFKTKV